MKKGIFALIVLFVGLGFGLGVVQAHAAGVTIGVSDLTPDQAAILNSQLAAMKESLIQLQGQYAALTPAPSESVSAPTPVAQTLNLSPEDAANLKSALTALSAALVALENKVQSSQLTPDQLSAVNNTLLSMGNTVSALASDLASANLAPQASQMAASGVSQPAATVENQPAPATNENNLGLVNPAPTQEENQGTAQVSSKVDWNKYRVPAIVVVLIVIVAVWFWRSRSKSKELKPKQNTALQVNHKEQTF